MQYTCIVCGGTFLKKGRALCCGKECSKENLRKLAFKAYKKKITDPQKIEAAHVYRNRPDVKARRRLTDRKRRSDPLLRKRENEYRRAWEREKRKDPCYRDAKNLKHNIYIDSRRELINKKQQENYYKRKHIRDAILTLHVFGAKTINEC